jgi:hypothetical protein
MAVKPREGSNIWYGQEGFGAKKEVERATTGSCVLDLETACHVQCGSQLATTSRSMS